MGAAVTIQFVRDDGVLGQGKEVLLLGKRCNMKNYEVDRMYDEFVKFEDKETHVGSVYDFLESKKIKFCPFLDFYFLLFDKRKTGMLPFVDFMLCLWNFLSSDSENIAVFLFLLFDTERSNVLDVDEIKYMVNAVWNFSPSHYVEKHLAELTANQDGILTLAEYMLFMRHYPRVLEPIVEARNKMRKTTVFKRFWEEIERRRTSDFSIKPIFLILGKDDPELNMCCLQYLAAHANTPRKFSEQWRAIIRRKQLTKYKVFDIPMELMSFSPPPVVKKRKKEDKGKVKEYDGVIFENPYAAKDPFTTSAIAAANANDATRTGAEIGEVEETKLMSADTDEGEIDSITLDQSLDQGSIDFRSIADDP
jgi:Ca2+-binding EF-hand superfamily protein